MKISIVYMVAGLSSRFGGKIKAFAKVTQEKSLIEYSLDQAISAGFEKIIFIVSPQTEQAFKDKFKNSYKNIQVEYAIQTYDSEKRKKPWGTCDAVCSIKNIVKESFVIGNGDDLYGEETLRILFKHLKTSEEEATIGYKLENCIPEKGSVNRGIFKSKENYIQEINETLNIEKQNLKEKKLTKDDLCSLNIFALHPETLNLLEEKLNKFKEKNKEDPEVECYLPTELTNLIKEEKIKIKIFPTTEEWMGITNPGDELIIQEKLNNNKVCHH